MPPGTGDTQLTFAQDVKIDGAIIVSTPQELALMDVQRGIQMFDKTKIKIVGLVAVSYTHLTLPTICSV